MNLVEKETPRSPLGEMLVREGCISPAELSAALSYRQERGVKLGQALLALHLVSEDDIGRALRSQGKVRCLHLTPGIVDHDVARLLSEKFARHLGAVPVHRIAGRITVAMEDPSETYDVDALSMVLGEPVFPVHAEPERIVHCLDAVFGCAEPVPALRVGDSIESPAAPRPTLERVDTGSQSDRARAAAVVRAALAQASAEHARAVLFATNGDVLELHFETDGQAGPVARLPRTLAAALLLEIESLAEQPDVPIAVDVQVRLSLAPHA